MPDARAATIRERAPRPTLREGRLTLRPSVEQDVAVLVELLAEPGVAAWWGDDNDAESVREELDLGLAIEVDSVVQGWLLVHEETEPMYRSVALDIALATAVQGQRLGRAALRMVIRHYVGLGHHRFQIDPTSENAAAIRCYAAVGFKPVGVLRRSERAPDGTWRDGLLMDLLADELKLR